VGQADGEIGAESVHGLFHGLAVVLAVGGNAGQIDKLDHDAAIAAGREFCGVAKR